MIRVLHICTDFWPNTGGIERFILDLSRHSLGRGLSPRVLCFNRIHNDSRILPESDRVDGIPVRRIPFLNLRVYKPTLLPLDELRDADVLHVHGIGAPLDCAVLTRPLHRRPIVLSTHGGIFHTPSALPLKRLYFNTIHRLAERFIDRTVACSEPDRAMFAPLGGRLTLIENGVELGRFRSAADLPKDPNRLVFVGRLVANKGVENLLRAFGHLHAARPELRLRIIGPDPDNQGQRLGALIRELDLLKPVDLLGELPDRQVAVELGQSAFFISASRHEGFGISAIEAMAAGCIPLLNDIPAFRSLIGGRDIGALVDFAHPAEAAAALGAYLSALPSGASRGARDRAEEFAWERIIGRWLDLYQRVAAGK